MLGMFKNINSKGQADAVFEVLIAVILLSFVLVVGVYSMKTLSESQCSKQIDISISEFSRNIETVASSALTSRYFNFNYPRCFGDANVEIITGDSLCQFYCPGSVGGCHLFRYENPKDKVSPLRYTCINVSPITTFNGASCTGIDNDEKNVFKQGRYEILSNSLTTPNICISNASYMGE